MIIEHFIEDGPLLMSVIYLMWIAVIILVIRFLIIYFKDNESIKLKRTNDAILFSGSLTFLIGIFGQTIGIFEALGCIQAAGDISPALITGGLKVSMISTLYGFGLLIISAIIWFIFRNMIHNQKPAN